MTSEDVWEIAMVVCMLSFIGGMIALWVML